MRRKKESKKPFIAGFVITVVVLFSLFFGLLYIKPPVNVVSLPAKVPQYNSLWGKYVPANFALFGFENYTAIREYNSSYPTQYSTLLDILDLKVSLKSTAINAALTVSFSAPNESIAFAFVNSAAFSNFTDAFANANFAATTVGEDSMYYVRNDLNGQIQFGWLALIPADQGIAFAIGNTDAKTAIQNCLQVTPANALISRLNVRQMLYVANGTANHLAIGIQGFPGVIPSANNTMTVVDATGTQVVVSRILEFGSTSTAVSEYSSVKQDYLNSRQFQVYDSYVQATEYEALSDVTGAVRLVE